MKKSDNIGFPTRGHAADAMVSSIDCSSSIEWWQPIATFYFGMKSRFKMLGSMGETV